MTAFLFPLFSPQMYAGSGSGWGKQLAGLSEARDRIANDLGLVDVWGEIESKGDGKLLTQ